jgi:hypothetical protein
MNAIVLKTLVEPEQLKYETFPTPRAGGRESSDRPEIC